MFFVMMIYLQYGLFADSGNVWLDCKSCNLQKDRNEVPEWYRRIDYIFPHICPIFSRCPTFLKIFCEVTIYSKLQFVENWPTCTGLPFPFNCSLYICNIWVYTFATYVQQHRELWSPSGTLEANLTDVGFGFEVLSPDNGIFRKPDDVHLGMALIRPSLNHCLPLVILSVGKKI